MSVTNPQESSPGQMDRESFLAHISEIDRANLLKLGSSFTKVLQQKGRRGALVVVGGILTKPLPRRDIDILLILDRAPNDLGRDNFSNQLEYAKADFVIFRDIANKIAFQSPNFVVGNEIEPFVDPEYNNPNILNHDGSTTLIYTNKQGTPIELIRMDKRGSLKEVLAKDSRPYLVLTSVT